jgi:hypothetical protein
MMVLTVFLASISTFAETPINAIHEDYLARKQRYEDRVIQARKEFTALCGQKAWKLVIDKPDKGGYHSSGEAHIELDDAMEHFAKEYTAMESAAALWNMLDDPDICLNAAAYVCGADKRLTSPNFSLMANKKDRVKMDLSSRAHIPGGGPKGPDFPFRPYFAGFDSQTVQADCRDKPARRREYIEAIVNILADPAIRKENPLEVKNLLVILQLLDATEAVSTVIDYLFYDFRCAGDYRISAKEMESVMEGSPLPNGFVNIPIACLRILPRLGTKGVEPFIAKLANTTRQERSLEVGGGGAVAFAICYFIRLEISEKQALKHITDYKMTLASLSQEQLVALEEVVDAIKEKKYRTDGLLKNSSSVIQGWAPSSKTND